VFCSYVSPLYVFGVVSLDVEPYHVQIVERHLVAVSAEDVHVVVLVDIRRVSVAGSWSSRNHAKLGLAHGGVAGRCKVACISAFAHLLVVGVEGVVVLPAKYENLVLVADSGVSSTAGRAVSRQ